MSWRRLNVAEMSTTDEKESKLARQLLVFADKLRERNTRHSVGCIGNNLRNQINTGMMETENNTRENE